MIHVHVSATRQSWWFAVMACLAVTITYVVAIDQGHMLSMVQGVSAFDTNLIHELVHDARHAAGLPCH